MLLFLVAFALPYVAKTIAWVAANRAQVEATEAFQRIRADLTPDILVRAIALEALFDSLQAAGEPHAWVADVASENVVATGQLLTSVDSSLQARLPTRGSEHWRTYRV